MTRNVAILALLLTAAAKPESAKDVVAKHIQAAGGADKLKALKSVRMTGEVIFKQPAAEGGEPTELKGPFILEMKRPLKSRLEYSILGMTAVQAYDGATAWKITPFAGDPLPKKMEADETADQALRSEFDGLLLDFEKRGIKVELAGKDKVDDAEVIKLKVTPKGGGERTVYLDAKTYLEVRRDETRTGRKEIVEARVGDYRKVDSLTLAHLFESGTKESPKDVVLKVDKIELNPELDDARFTMPENPLVPIPTTAPLPPGMPFALPSPAAEASPTPVSSPSPVASPAPR